MSIARHRFVEREKVIGQRNVPLLDFRDVLVIVDRSVFMDRLWTLCSTVHFIYDYIIFLMHTERFWGQC